MAEEKKQPALQFLTCPKCLGSGKLEKQKCLECKGIGIYAWTGSRLLYWSKKIDFISNSQVKLKNLIKNTVNLILFIFGMLGLFALGWVMLSLNETNTFVWEFYKIQNWQLLIFWLSLGTDSYLLYRFNRELDKIKKIPKREYELTPKTYQLISWDKIKNLPKDKIIDIVPYFTYQPRQSFIKAWEMTHKYGDAKVNQIHLLVALLTYEQVQIIFSRIGISFEKLKNKVSDGLASEPNRYQDQTIEFEIKIKQLMFQSYFLAYRLRSKKVELTEVLEVLVLQDGKVKELLYDLDIDSDKIKNVIAWMRNKKILRAQWQKFRQRASLRPKHYMNRSMTAIATPALNAFSQDLTLLARSGYLQPCIDRTKEIEEIINIMHGGTRRSVILVGESGVGKNTIVEGIAQRMTEEEVPKFMQDKRLVNLDVAKLVSGVTPAQAQERLLILLNEIRRSGNIILYISDIHNMIGVSAGGQGGIDVADVLAKTLDTNNVLAITTSTPAEYRSIIEGKSSLDNVLEKVEIKEVSGNQAIRILQAKVGSIEYKNNVFFAYDALAQAVKLSDRYLHDRYLPEKAVEILQEVATHVASNKGKNAIVAKNDVAQIISNKTNIPLTEITQKESEKLLNLEQKIHERMIGQDEAVDLVAASLRRARAEMRDTRRPIVNLLFLGPTGVGKTELAKTVAEVYFGNEDNMIRLDMSEYQEKNSINRLIGAPPGYQDTEKGGFLSEAVRKNLFSLVLLDEIEKAHPDILHIFLQIMDDGRLTDSVGRTIDFTNTIIIATSNAGTKFIQDEVGKGTPLAKIKNELIENRLTNYFRPELLNRFNGIVVFKPLEMTEVQQIAQLMINKVAKQLEEKGIGLEATQQAIAYLAREGFDKKFGARPLRRVIQKKVQDPLANLILENKIGRRDTAVIQADGQIVIEKAKKI